MSGVIPDLQVKNESSDCPDTAHNKPPPNKGPVQRASSLKFVVSSLVAPPPIHFA